MQVTIPKYARPVGKLNFGGAEYVDLQGADMSRVSGIQSVHVLNLSNTYGLRGNWNFSQFDKVFLCNANLSKVKYLQGAKVISFYGVRGLRGVIDLTDTKQAYFFDVDFSNVKTILCRVNTVLSGLDSCKNWQGKIKYSYVEPVTEKESILAFITRIIEANQRS